MQSKTIALHGATQTDLPGPSGSATGEGIRSTCIASTFSANIPFHTAVHGVVLTQKLSTHMLFGDLRAFVVCVVALSVMFWRTKVRAWSRANAVDNGCYIAE